MKIKDTLVVSNEFSDHPGARYKSDGEWSGERFLEELLRERFLKAVNGKYVLLVDVDKMQGCPSSFISGSFGILSQTYNPDVVLRHLQIKSDDNPIRKERIIQEIKEPNKIYT